MSADVKFYFMDGTPLDGTPKDYQLRQKYLGLSPDQLLALSREDWEEWTSVATPRDLEPVTWEACQRRSRAKRRDLILARASVAAPLMLVAAGGIGLAVLGVTGNAFFLFVCAVVSIACWAGLN
jgi:hypothetical protein